MPRFTCAFCALILILCVGSAWGANSVVVESKYFNTGQTACSIGVHVTNDLYLLGIVMPLEARAISGNGYPAAINFWGLQPGRRIDSSPLGSADPNGQWPPALVIADRFAVPSPTMSCTGPVAQSWNIISAGWDGVSPDAVFFVGLSMGDPRVGDLIYLEPGADPAGTSNASLLFVLRMNNGVGCFVIDTCCRTPANHLAFEPVYDPSDPFNFYLLTPSFTPGIISVGTSEPCGTTPPPANVAIDIKPRSCPNPFAMKDNGSSNDKSVLPVAVLGSSDLDVADIDPTSVRLNGVAPMRWSLEDVGTPVDGSVEDCDCTTAGRDGYTDLSLKFDKSEIAATLGPVEDGDYIALVLTGELSDGTSIEGEDCILIRGNEPAGAPRSGRSPVVAESYPNPFNAATTIRYTLEEAGDVSLTVFNVLGQRVAVLTDEYQTEGQYEVTWSAHGAASGIYFYRLQVNGHAITRQMTLVK